MPRIVLKKKAEILAEYRIEHKNTITIGSAKGNSIIIKDKNISEHHCSITRKDAVYEIKDNNTLSGTRVNDKSITTKELQFGDAVGVGLHTLAFLPNAPKSGKNTSKSDRSEDMQGSSGGVRPHFLLGIYGKFEGKKYEVNLGETYVGRENVSPKGITNDIVLSGDMTVSKGHAKISRREEQTILSDIGSTGGVAINGNKVGQLNDVPLTIGDEIAIGRTIFRYTEDGKDDYSIPKRHNIFLLKIRQPVLIAGALIVILSSLFAVGKGISSISVINGSPKKLDIEINRYWSPEDNMVRASASEYDITSTPAIGDINNDGANEIVSFNSSGLLYAWNGKKGTLLWKPVEIFNSGKSSPVLADMNNDGVVDIVVLSDTSMLYIIDGQTGGVVRREILGGTIAEITPVVCDLDVDGKMDVVVCAEEGMVHFIYAPGFESGMEKYSEFVEGPLYASPVVITTKKLSPMVVVCSYNSKVYVFDGKTRGKKTVDLVEKTGKAHLLSAAPAVGDLDGDGIPEIVVQSNVPQYVSAIDITSFEVNWTYFVEPVPPAGLKHNASPIVTDINNNGLGDVVVFSANGIVYGLKGKTGYPAGELLWKIDIPGGSRMVSSPALYDFDKDGIKEMVFGTEGGIVYVVKSLPRRKEMEIVSMPRASNAPITSSVAIGDVNRDGEIEIVCSNDTNTLQILNTNVRTFKNNIYWPMYLGNALHTGQSVYYDDPQPYVIMIISGLAVLVLVLILYIVVINKNLKKRPRMVAI